MKKNALLFIALLVSGIAIGQDTHLRVLSENGLKLRAAPSKTAKVLDVAPFWAEVELLPMKPSTPDRYEKEFPMDTFGLISKSPKWAKNNWVNWLEGRWIPVKFNGKSGFMHSAFLGKGEMEGYDFIELNNEFRIRNSYGNWCFTNNIEPKKSWAWSGLFKTEKGFQIRPIELRYLNVGEGATTFYSTEINEQPLFFFGTKYRLPDREVSGFYAFDSKNPPFTELKKLGLSTDEASFNNGGNSPWYAILPNGAKQGLKLSAKTAKGENYDFKIRYVLWAGDLDGDGKNDYILNGGDPYPGCTGLFLSSKAKKGEAVHLVAALFNGSCC